MPAPRDSFKDCFGIACLGSTACQGWAIYADMSDTVVTRWFHEINAAGQSESLAFKSENITFVGWTLSSISRLSGCLPCQNTVDKLLTSIKALSQNHQHSYFRMVTSLEHMCSMQTILSCPVLKQMHMLTTFCLSDVPKSYPLIVKKTVLLKIIYKSSEDRTMDACSLDLGEAGSRQQ